MCCNAVLDACARSGELDVAEEWLGKHGQLERAAAWLPRMRSLRAEPEVTSYNAVFDACARSGELGRAEGWLGKHCQVERAAARLPRLRSLGAEPDGASHQHAMALLTDRKCTAQPLGCSCRPACTSLGKVRLQFARLLRVAIVTLLFCCQLLLLHITSKFAHVLTQAVSFATAPPRPPRAQTRRADLAAARHTRGSLHLYAPWLPQ